MVVDAKFDSIWPGWSSNEVRGAYGVGVWKFISNGWEYLSNFRFVVGQGARVRFWLSFYRRLHGQFKWLGAVECEIHLSCSGLGSGGSISDFYSTLYALNLECGGEDKLLWIYPGNKKFSFRSLYKIMSTHSSTVFPWKCIWKSKLPLKVVVLVGWPRMEKF